MTMELILKNFIIQEFKEYGIPSGYHTFNCINNDGLIIMSLKADTHEHSYITRITSETIKTKLKDCMLINNLNVNIKDLVLTIEIALNEFDEYKIKLRNEFPGVYPKIHGSVNYKKLYQQLKMYLIVDINQELYDLVATHDENYYNDLFLSHWNSNVENIDLSNDEIIKAFPEYLNYDNISSILNNKDLLDFVVKNFDFDSGADNYILLQKLIELNNFDIVEVLIKVFKDFNDQGILITVVKSTMVTEKKWNELFNLLNEWYFTQKQGYLSDLVNNIIEYNHIYYLTVLLKEGLLIKDDYLILAKELKRNKIYYLLCNHLDS